jgi:DNA-binding FrmR family transcriptional regulator
MKSTHGHRQNSELLVKRLKRIAGQVGGVARMIEEERYCIDILTQMRAVKAALGKVEDAILERHASSCVAEALRSGSAAEQEKKFRELVGLFGRFKS